MSNEKNVSVEHETPSMTLGEFLESTPPGSEVHISDLSDPDDVRKVRPTYYFSTPDIQLHCARDSCNGIRFFVSAEDALTRVPDDEREFIFITYVCSNCRQTRKLFSLAVKRDEDLPSGTCYKLGEVPEYGPPTPSKLMKLVGPDRELFLKGRRCENQGLGIGAFVYYRRVVEGQKNRILDEIIKISKKLGVAPEQIKQLEDAKAETQFSKALANVKNAIPQSLLINGHNPLLLLHSALSEGLHAQSDHECLEIASSVRIVLAELSERLAQALRDEAELNKAVSRLMPLKR